MNDSLLLLPLRLGLRTARASLHATRDLADLGLATLEVVERTLGNQPPATDEEPAQPAAGSFSDREGQEPSQPARRPDPVPSPDDRDSEPEPPPDELEPEPEPPAAVAEPEPPAVVAEPEPPAAVSEPEPPAAVSEPEPPADEPEPSRPVSEPEPPPAISELVPEPPEPEATLVEEVADPGAEDGAGASLRVAPPFAGYDELRAADVIARLGGADLAELGETELYERTHRARRTVLEAIAREIKRRPPGWVDQRP